MIIAENITKSFGNLQVLKGVSLKIEKGKVASIVGASGAGKTTLLQILGTLSNPDSGILSINGVNPTKQKRNGCFRNKHIGLYFSFIIFYLNLQLRMCLPAFIANTSEKAEKEQANYLLFRLSDRLHHKPTSFQVKNKVAVARAMINNPSVIFADEPTES